MYQYKREPIILSMHEVGKIQHYNHWIKIEVDDMVSVDFHYGIPIGLEYELMVSVDEMIHFGMKDLFLSIMPDTYIDPRDHRPGDVQFMTLGYSMINHWASILWENVNGKILDYQEYARMQKRMHVCLTKKDFAGAKERAGYRTYNDNFPGELYNQYIKFQPYYLLLN